MTRFLLPFIALLFSSITAWAQPNHLRSDFKLPGGAPNLLNVCGAPDTVTYVIRTEGLSGLPRTNIQSAIRFFKGIEMIGFLSNLSSPGVFVLNGTNPSRPIFTIPDLNPSGTNSVEITVIVAADCRYADTLAVNGSLAVRDAVEHFYVHGSGTLSETDLTSEYRTALKTPSLSIAAQQSVLPPARAGQCFSRSFIIANAALEGFTDTLIYQNRQGAGVSIRQVFVEGVAIPVTKTVQGIDTIVTARIAGTYLQLAKLGSNPGDGDIYFDPNESLVVREEFCLITCSNSRVSRHTAAWGCKGRLCVSTAVDGFVQTGQGQPNALITNTPSDPANITVGYCKPGAIKVVYRNSGVAIDPGFADMQNLELQIGLTNAYLINHPYVTVTKLSVAGKLVPIASTLVINNNPLFATDPDGPGGLSDLDNDGFFDDLAPNQSFTLLADYEFNCTNARQPGPDSLCFNDINLVWNTQLKYLDPCGLIVAKSLGNFGAIQSTDEEYVNCIDPDAFPNQKFTIKHIETRGVRNFGKECGGQERFVVWAKLPAGVTAVATDFKIFKNNSSFETMRKASYMSGDTLFVEFDATNPFLNGKYELEASFTPDCTVPAGRIKIPFGFLVSCPPCGCKHDWYCEVIEGPQFHPTVPPCATGISCPAGLQTTDFDVVRTTMGFTGPDYTTRTAAAAANTNVAIQCDSILMSVCNLVGQTPITDSIGVIISYDNVEFIKDTNQIFLFDKGTLRINRGGQILNCPVDKSMLHVTAGDTSKVLRFNFHSCLTTLGVTLQPGDSVKFYGTFLVNPKGAMIDNFRKVPNFRAFGFAVINGDTLACDNFGENFDVCKIPTVVAIPGGPDFPKGCANTPFSYRLITKNVGFTDYYGSEYYPAVKVDSLVLNYDTTLLSTFSNLEVKVSIPGHPTHGNNFYTIHTLTAADKGRYVAKFDTLVRFPSHNIVQSYSFNLQVGLAPGCESLTGSATNNNLYKLNPTFYYADNYFAKWFGDGSCSPDTIVARTQNLTYSEPPTVNFESVSNPSLFLSTDTAEWIVKQCNTSTKSDALLTWLSTGFDTTQLQLISVELIDDPANVQNLPIKYFGTGQAFVFTPAIFRQSNNNTSTAICNFLRIRAVPKICGTTNVKLEMGWNCAPYADTTWTPASYTPCVADTLGLQVTTLDGSVEATIIGQPPIFPNVCDTISLELLVRNNGQGRLFDVNSIFSIPLQAGQYIDGSAQVAWPSDAPYQNAIGDPVFLGSNIKGRYYVFPDFALLHAGLDANGLTGFDPNNPTTSNEFKIKYSFVAGCDFNGGAQIFYEFRGFQACGQASNFEAGESFPIYFNGLTPPIDKGFDPVLGLTSFLTSGSTSTLEININNLTSAVSDTFDKVTIKLPSDIVYVPGSTVAIRPGNWPLGNPVIQTIGSVNILTWPMPLGLTLGDTATLRFDVTSPTLSCNSTVEAGLSTVRDTTLLCFNGSQSCGVSVISSGEEEFFTLSVGSHLTFAGGDINTCAGGQVQIGQVLPGYTNYQWQPANLLNNAFIATPTANITASTIFTVTAIDSLGCLRADSVRVNVGGSLNIQTTPTAARCGLANGAIQVSVLGGQGTYTYSWIPTNLIGNHPMGLAAGTYTVVVTDTATGCTAMQSIQVPAQGTGITFTNVSMPATTTGVPGSIDLLFSQGTNPFAVAWSSTNGTMGSMANITTPSFSIPSLLAGIYTVTVTDAFGCSAMQSITVSLINIANLMVTASGMPDTSCCAGTGTAMIQARGGTRPFTLQFLPNTGTIQQVTDSLWQVTLLDAGMYQVTVTDATGLTATATINVADACQCNEIFEDEVVYDVSGIESFCLPIPYAYINDYPLFINGQPYTGPIQGCDFDTVVYYAFSYLNGQGFNGPYKLMNWTCNNVTISNVIFQDLYELADSLNTWDPNGYWLLDDSNSTISGGDLDQIVYGSMQIMHMPTWTPYTAKVNYTGFAYGSEIYVNPFEDKYVVTAYDSTQCCSDTLCIILLNPCDNLIPQEPYTITAQQTEVCLPLEFAFQHEYFVFYDRVRQFNVTSCDGGNGTAFSVPLVPGMHEIIVIDTVALCADTVPVIVFNQVMPSIAFLTTQVNAPVSICADTTELPGIDISTSVCGLQQYGSLSLQNLECWVYQPNANFIGIDTVCIHAQDEFGYTDTSIFVITIVPPPFSLNVLTFAGVLDSMITSICVDTTELLGDITSISLCDQPNNGVMTLLPPHCLTYQPNPGFSGIDSACVLLCDHFGLCDTTQIFINISPDQFLPPSPDTLRLTTNINIGIPNICPVLSQIGGVATSFALCSPAQNGSTSIAANCINYQPNVNFVGVDSFCMYACNGVICDTTYVYITIEPDVTGFTTDIINITTQENTPSQWFCVNLLELGVALPASFSLCSAPQQGTATLNEPCFYYTPSAGYVGTDQFCIIACNLAGQCDTTIVNVTVEPNNANLPTPHYIYLTTQSGWPTADTCVDLSEIGGVATSFNLCAFPTNGQVLTTSPCFIYTPTATFVGQDTFCLVACNAVSLCDTTYVIVTVQSSLAPVTDTLTLTTFVGTPTANTCLDLSEIGGTALTFGSCSSPANGTVAYTNPCFVYTPSAGYLGQDTFCVVACNASGICDTTIVVVSVQPVPTPLIDTIYVSTSVSTPSASTCVNLTQIGGAAMTFGFCAPPTQGTATLANPCFVYTPDTGYIGQDTFCLIACSSGNICDTTIVIVTVLPPTAPVIDTIRLTTPYQTTTPSICLDTTQLNGSVISLIICDQPVGMLLQISANCLIYNPPAGFVGNDTACVYICDATGLCDTTIIIITTEPLPAPDCGLFNPGDITVEVFNNAQFAEICLPLQLDSVQTFDWFIDGTPYANGFMGCDFDSCFDYTYFTIPDFGDNGPYMLNFWQLNGTNYSGTFQDVEALVDSMNLWDPLGKWSIRPVTLSIISCERTPNLYGDMRITQLSSGAIGILELNLNLIPKGTAIRVPVGEHEIIVNGDNGCADTLNVNVQPAIQIAIDTVIYIGTGSDTLCLTDYGVGSAGLTQLTNLCPQNAGNNVTLTLDTATLCLVYTGIAPGPDTLCYKLGYGTDSCAYVTIVITALQPIPCIDFIHESAINATLDCDTVSQTEVCIDIPFALLDEFAVSINGQTVTPTQCAPNAQGIPQMGLIFDTTGIYQVVFNRTALNCADTVSVVVACDNGGNNSNNLTDTIYVGETDSLCLDLSSLPGNITTITNVCPVNGGNFIDFGTTTNPYCVTYTGLAEGTETACIVVCTDQGVCDTILVTVTAFPPPNALLPIAITDFDTIRTANTVSIAFLANDTTNGNLTLIDVITPPNNGTVVLNGNQLLYEGDSCGTSDSLRYRICNTYGCDTAWVYINHPCPKFKIYTGFSPNGDMINEFFHIDGLESFLDHEIKIYNRWGARVFQTKQYRNNWNGDWNGKPLPDGTYFYIFDDGEGETHSGALTIQR